MYDHVAFFDGIDRAGKGIVFDVLVYAAFLPDSGGVDHPDHPVFKAEILVDRVPCRAGDVGYDRAFVTQEWVEQGGFTRIRPADDRNTQIRGHDRSFLLGQQFDDFIEQERQVQPVQGRDRDDVQVARFEEIGHVFEVFFPVHFVYGGDDRHWKLSEVIGQVVVERFGRRAFEEVYDHGWARQVAACVREYGLRQFGAAGDVESGRVGERERHRAELHVEGQHVPCKARKRVDDRLFLFYQRVEEGRFADILSSDDCYERQSWRHWFLPCLIDPADKVRENGFNCNKKRNHNKMHFAHYLDETYNIKTIELMQ